MQHFANKVIAYWQHVWFLQSLCTHWIASAIVHAKAVFGYLNCRTYVLETKFVSKKQIYLFLTWGKNIFLFLSSKFCFCNMFPAQLNRETEMVALTQPLLSKHLTMHTNSWNKHNGCNILRFPSTLQLKMDVVLWYFFN